MQQRGTRARSSSIPAANQPAARAPFPTRDLLAILILCAASIVIYLPVSRDPGPHRVAGAERAEADLRRIGLAREALISPHPQLPAWDARQFTGVPFWGSTHNFPWIPNRLALLAVSTSLERCVYDIAVALAAVLAALVTYAYARRLGLAPLAAALAGWTFAAAQLFATKVAAGQLPILETFCSLPLLLWLVERAVQSGPDQPGARDRALLALGLATACVMLGGDARLPAVAIGVAILYALYRAGRRGFRPVLAIILGIGCAAFARWPMLLLMQRSVRLPRGGDVETTARELLHSAWYAGWIPVVAMAFVAIAWFLRGWPRNRVWGFLLIISVVSVIAALVSGRWVEALLYLPVFALAITLGVAVQLLMLRFALKGSTALCLGLAVIVLLHVADLVWHDRAVARIETVPAAAKVPAALTFASLSERVGDGRIAIDPELWPTFDAARQLDDLSAAGPHVPMKAYRLLADLHGSPLPSSEAGGLNAAALSQSALAAAGVRLVVARGQRADLLPAGGSGDVHIYRVPDAASRAAFFAARETRFVPVDQLHDQIRRGEFDLRRALLLPGGSAAASSVSPTVPPEQSWAAAVRYRRERGDEIALSVKSGVSGYVRVIESFDPGWRAAIDGHPAPVLAADDAWLAVAVPEGAHEVVLRYHTPGATSGAVVSGVCFLLLVVVMFVRFERRPAEPDRPH